MNARRISTIQARLNRLLIGFLIPLALLLGALLYMFVKGELLDRLDNGLEIRAQALTGMLVTQNGKFELNFADETMPQYGAGATNEYFQVCKLNHNQAGELIERSDSLGQASLILKDISQSASTWLTCSWYATLPSGKSGRYLALRYKPSPDEENDGEMNLVRADALAPATANAPTQDAATTFNVNEEFVFIVAQSSAEIDGALALLSNSLVVAGLVLIAGTLFIVRHALGRGLAPLPTLAADIQSINPKNLTQRLDETNLPQELLPIAQRVNQLLDQVWSAFEREKKIAASAAHELRTPIAELRAVTELALHKERQASEYRHALQSVLETTLRMGCATDAVLRLARVQSGRETVVLENVDVGGALTPIWKRLIEPLHSRNIRTEFTIEQGTNVRADAAMLAVILENLCVNAAAHTQSGGDVLVACHTDHDRIHLVMSNSTGQTQNSHDPIKNNAQDNFRHAQLRAQAQIDLPTNQTTDQRSILQTNLHSGLGLLIADSMCQAIGATLHTAQTTTRYIVTLELQRA